jgi:pimeloyl-ACP methyl ester carboxylesterase
MRRGYADTRLGQMHYTTWGDKSHPPLVLLPQSANSATMFWNLAAALEADFYLVVPDFPGSGWSDPLPEEITFQKVGAAFIEVLDHLGLAQFALYGHHVGNKVAAAMAANYPDRVSKLIFVGQSRSIVASNAQRSGTVGSARRKLLESADQREAALVQWADLFNRINSRWWNDELVRDIGNDARRAFVARKVADELLSAMSVPQLFRAILAYDLEHDLRTLTAPTLVIEIASPSEDASAGRQGEILKKIMKNATVAVLEEPNRTGNSMEHRAADLARLVRDFLKPPSN